MMGLGMLVLCLWLFISVRCDDLGKHSISKTLPNTTYSGYVDIEPSLGSAMFYAYYEAQEGPITKDTPVLLWLQGGPGCASMFGNLYELGPQSVTPELDLQPNPGAWNRLYGLLFIDQPIGTGFSLAGEEPIPTDELKMADDLYLGMQQIFDTHKDLHHRPLIITGESYAGKYVPSISHFVLQLEVELGLRNVTLQRTRELPERAVQQGSPKFRLLGLAIGNGLTDPEAQVLTHADTAYFLGMIDLHQRIEAMRMQLEISQYIAAGDWPAAASHRSILLEYIAAVSATATLFDMRRQTEYDDEKAVDRYLNLPEVKAALGVSPNVTFESCSEAVGDALRLDVMKSIKDLLPDLLDNFPILLYQGQFDAQDGPATTEAWLSTLEWAGSSQFSQSKREVWQIAQSHLGAQRDSHQTGEELVVGYWKHYDTLTQVVIKNAGHMVPHDQPRISQYMIEKWVKSQIETVNRQASAS